MTATSNGVLCQWDKDQTTNHVTEESFQRFDIACEPFGFSLKRLRQSRKERSLIDSWPRNQPSGSLPSQTTPGFAGLSNTNALIAQYG